MEKKLSILLMFCLLAGISTAVDPNDPNVIWDVRADWIDELDQSINPNLPWTYRDATAGSRYGNLLVWKQAGTWGSGPCYAPSPTGDEAPILFTSGGMGQEDPNGTEFGGHAPYMVRWTSPIDGWIRVSGYIYVGADAPLDRILEWRLLKNNILFASGLTANGLLGYENRVNFRDGLGGAEVLILSVNQGDNIDYVVIGAPLTAAGHGELQITQIDEPSETVILTMTVSPDIMPNPIDTVNPSVGSVSVYVNSSPLITASRFVNCPQVYEFDHWEGAGIADPSAASTTVLMAENRTVTAVYVDGRACGDTCHPISAYDSDQNCMIDLTDFSAFALEWLNCTQPTPECDGF